VTAVDSSLLLSVQAASRRYRLQRQALFAAAPTLHALREVSFDLCAGRSLGVVGESGSGKSTLARLVMALEKPDAGRVVFDGVDLASLTPAELRRARAGFQMVFQDPYGSLDPRQTVARIVAEPLEAQPGAAAAARREAAAAMLVEVGLRAADLDRYPHQFSGGQRQRIAIARALVTRPRLIVADEPVSALDVSVQAQVLNLMLDLQDAFGVAYLFISHDLAVVNRICDDLVVLYQGRVVERGAAQTLFGAAAHPYTRALVDAVPGLRPRGSRLATTLHRIAPPTAANEQGCAYAARCPRAAARCLSEAPLLRAVAAGHDSACHFAEQVATDAPPR
jgi:peptide/nickel transport system ATP-binding protein